MYRKVLSVGNSVYNLRGVKHAYKQFHYCQKDGQSLEGIYLEYFQTKPDIVEKPVLIRVYKEEEADKIMEQIKKIM